LKNQNKETELYFKYREAMDKYGAADECCNEKAKNHYGKIIRQTLKEYLTKPDNGK
jgi:hypothetical protein